MLRGNEKIKLRLRTLACCCYGLFNSLDRNIGRLPRSEKHTPSLSLSSLYFCTPFPLVRHETTEEPTSKQCKPLIPVRESIRKPYLNPESTLSTTITSNMPAYIPCPTCMVSINTSHHQSTTTYHHKVVCAHPPRADGSMSVDPNRWNMSSKEYNLSVAPMPNPTTLSSLQSPPPLVHVKSPYSCVALPPLPQFHVAINPLLERGTSERIDYDVRMHPSTAKKLHGFSSVSQWQAEAAINPSLGSLTIRSALVERSIVVFPGNMDRWIVTIYNVLLAVHYTVCMSVTDDHRRRQLEGCYKWVGLTPSPTEHDVWILLTR